jgi:hypothetical protein
MVKICRTGLLKINFEIIPKKRIFRVLPKRVFRRPWMKLKIFFCQFPNPWTLRVSGMGGYTSKCEKKSKSLHPNVYIMVTVNTADRAENIVKRNRFWRSRVVQCVTRRTRAGTPVVGCPQSSPQLLGRG